MEGLNNSQVEKKNQEYKSVITLISHLPNSSDYQCKNDPNQERPDFIVANGNRSIGIEVVSAFISGKDYISERENTIRKCFDKCLHLLNLEDEKTPIIAGSQSYYYPLYTILIPTGIMSTDIDAKLLEQDLMNFLKSGSEQYYCETGITIKKDSKCCLCGHLKLDIIYTIGKSHVFEIKAENADKCNKYSSIIREEHPLTEIINNKSTLLGKYKQLEKNKTISEWWLCISLPHSSQIGFAEYKISDEIQHGFDKIYLVDNVINRTCELNYVNTKENNCLTTKI